MRHLLLILFSLTACSIFAQNVTVWNIGTQDNSAADLALGPADYKKFLSRDFGYEDGFYLVGKSTPAEHFPYVLPGPDDTWGGTWNTSGWRTHQTNILFNAGNIPAGTTFRLVVDMLDCNPKRSLFKVLINNKQSAKFDLKGSNEGAIEGKGTGKSRPITVTIDEGVICPGGNEITLTVLEGSWFVFDDVRLEATGNVPVTAPDKVFVRDISAAGYEIMQDGKRYQPLVVDVEALADKPAALTVELDGKKIFSTVVENGRYQYEAPMPAVKAGKESKYELLIDGVSTASGRIVRAAGKLSTPADYVDTKLGSAHSRWMIAPGPWMPMSMVKMSPDNQNRGWQAGYQPSFETVGCFSHIHEWTMGGLGLMPTNGALQTTVGDQFTPDAGYRSRIDKLTEEAPLGYYKVYMTDTDILAEVTATTRCGFSRYTFPTDKGDGRVMIDLHVEAEYDYLLPEVEVTRVSDYRIEGRSRQISPRPHVWSNDADQDYTVHFVVEFDRPIKKTGGWLDERRIDAASLSGKDLKQAGMWVEFDTKTSPVVQVRSSISLVSIANASLNLEQEITAPFGWRYDAVVDNQKKVWNDILERVAITTDNRMEKMRFYTNMYRAMCRNTWSDVNGEWMSAGGKVQKFNHPGQVALGCDAFWNSFWNLNPFWNLVTPEWSSRWVHSQLAMYDADGWLAKGPAGMKYIPVMVAEHEIPLMVSAWQMGIRDFDAEKALKAMVKMQTTPAQPVATGFAGNRDLVPYLTYHYVPSDMGRFSNTLEYAYDDWAVGQFAGTLGKKKEYNMFSERGTWWRNAINPENGYAHLRESSGKFTEDFDPFRSGANRQYVEGNSWQLSYFVPQDVPGLVNIMGEKAFVDRLHWGFTASEPWRYNAPNDQYWDYPVVQGNQQSMHFAFLFNWANCPWLTQQWSRSIMDKYYGYGLANAYLGDEDQGQMSAWLVMAAIGLFQTDGGASMSPIYEIASPLYEKVTIDLGERYGRGKQFTIEARGASKANKYVQSATLNGRRLDTFWFPASELLGGGSLVLEMGSAPNTKWGIGLPEAKRNEIKE